MLFGFVVTVFGARTHYDPGEPYLLQMFYLFNALDFICLVIGLVSAFPLWRLRRAGLLLCNLLFGFELLYFFANAFLQLAFLSSSSQVLKGIAMSMAGATGIGGLGLALQYVTAYPVIALIALNVAYHKLQRTEKQGTE